MIDRNPSPVSLALALMTLLISAFSLWISVQFGADIFQAFKSSVCSVLVLGGGLTWFWLQSGHPSPNWLARTVFITAGIWPAWWSTITSIATNRGAPHDLLFRRHFSIAPTTWSASENTWWADWRFYAATEAILVTVFIMTLIRGTNRR